MLFKRTVYCGEIGSKSGGGEETVSGWVAKVREMGGLVFVLVRDRTGLAQAVFSANEVKGGFERAMAGGASDGASSGVGASGGASSGGAPSDGASSGAITSDGASSDALELFESAKRLRGEYVVSIRGVVRERSAAAVNPNMKTGRHEIVATALHVWSKSETPPIYIEEGSDVNEATRLKYRYLDLRRPDMQRNLVLRHRAAKIARDYFDECGFLEIETPMLTKSTPEGARDYLVPSRVYPGRFFALPQSPQLFKQLLMVAGFDRYMQIARCFRDEDLRADRQPEFTQIDTEMSFVDVDDVISVNEGFLRRLFKEAAGVELPTPFQRITYADAMLRYGSDKPDLRPGPGMDISDLTRLFAGAGFKPFDDAADAGGAVRAFVAKGCAGFSRKELDALAEEARSRGANGLAWASVSEAGEIRSSFAKRLRDGVMQEAFDALGAGPGDLALFASDASPDIAATALGHVRLVVAKKCGLLPKDAFMPVWVVEFPLLERDDEAGRWVARHHPFTAPMDEDVPLMDTDPGAVRAKAYDVAMNGMEVGGGSIRVNTTGMQAKLFGLLGFSEEDAYARFGFLMDALKYGAPPHGGIAYGLERLVMILSGCDSIRDVIAFPKVQTSSCLMTGAPSAVEGSQLLELGISEGPLGQA